jgi:hypothetical protein
MPHPTTADVTAAPEEVAGYTVRPLTLAQLGSVERAMKRDVLDLAREFAAEAELGADEANQCWRAAFAEASELTLTSARGRAALVRAKNVARVLALALAPGADRRPWTSARVEQELPPALQGELMAAVCRLSGWQQQGGAEDGAAGNPPAGSPGSTAP